MESDALWPCERPPTFQRAMTVALRGCEDFAAVYIDDILIFSPSIELHLQHLTLVFQKLQQHAYHVRLSKCQFLSPEVHFLGHKLSARGIEHVVKHSKDLAGFHTPFTKPKQVRSFLGLVIWYKSFIPHVSTIAAPLFPLTSERRKFAWTDHATLAVEALKRAILEAPVLAKFNRDLPTRVTTDASTVGIGAVLEQQHEEGWRPVAFWSRKLKDPETRYSATDIEWLAVVDAVTLTWRHMLEDIPFLIRSDHKALERKLLKSAHDPPLLPRQTRWIERLMPYAYSFEYIKGMDNTVADALSRCPYMLNTVTVIHSLLAGLLARMKIAASQDLQYQQDLLEIRTQPAKSSHPPTLDQSPTASEDSPPPPIASPNPSDTSTGHSESLVLPPPSPQDLDVPTSPPSDPNITHPSDWPTSRFTKADRLIREGLIVYPNGVIVVPHDNELRTLLLAEAHDSRMSGHFGIEKTLEKIRRFWTWQGVAHDVEMYVQSCVKCQKTKHETSRPKGLLYPLVATRPWQMVTLDFVGKFAPAVDTRHNTCLVIVDKFSKYTILEGVPDTVDARMTANLFIKRVVAAWGVPSVVISDRGPQFSAQLWQTVLKILGSHSALATSHHPQTDGQTERAIQTLLRLIRSYASEQQDQWEAMLPVFEYALNDAYCKATLTTPFRLLRGYDPVGPQQFMVGRGNDTNMLPRGTWERKWAESQETLWKFVQQRQKEIALRMKERYDQNRKALDLQPSDLVLLSTKSHQLLEGYRKQRERFVGPYVVKERVYPNAYRLTGLPDGIPPTQNVRFLLRYHTSPERFNTRPEADAPIPELIDGDYEWEVENIQGHRATTKGTRYLVKWKGFSRKQWIHESNMEHTKDMLQDYHNSIDLPLTPFLATNEDIDPDEVEIAHPAHPSPLPPSRGPSSDSDESVLEVSPSHSPTTSASLPQLTPPPLHRSSRLNPPSIQ